MNIGIDIDGVLTDVERATIDFGTKMCVEEDWPITIDLGEYWETKVWGWTEEQANKFWSKYWIKYSTKSKPRMFAKEIIDKLKQEGHNIYIITARNEEDGMPIGYEGKRIELTKAWLKKEEIKYDKFISADNGDKLQKCIENNIDVMIEDSPENIRNISTKIKVIKFDCQYNKNVSGENIFTAYSWYHIYDIIKKVL